MIIIKIDHTTLSKSLVSIL